MTDKINKPSEFPTKKQLQKLNKEYDNGENERQ